MKWDAVFLVGFTLAVVTFLTIADDPEHQAISEELAQRAAAPVADTVTTPSESDVAAMPETDSSTNEVSNGSAADDTSMDAPAPMLDTDSEDSAADYRDAQDFGEEPIYKKEGMEEKAMEQNRSGGGSDDQPAASSLNEQPSTARAWQDDAGDDRAGTLLRIPPRR